MEIVNIYSQDCGHFSAWCPAVVGDVIVAKMPDMIRLESALFLDDTSWLLGFPYLGENTSGPLLDLSKSALF